MGFEKAPLAEAEASALNDIVLPEQVAGFSLDSLTPAQLHDIDSGPGRVNQPVELAEFTHHMELNNFPLYFAPADSIAGLIYSRAPCNRRFQVIYPEFSQTLQAHFHIFRKGNMHNGESRQRILLYAYKLMAALVDKADPGATNADGTVNRYYLWQ